MYYIITMVAFLIAYAIIVRLMPRLKNKKMDNAVFIAVSFVCYVALAVKIYLDVGFNDWNFQNVLPTANVSPFMFFTLIIYVFLPEKPKKAWSGLISLLSLGLLLSPVLACISRAVIHYKFHFSFLLDYIAHVSLSLLGVYLVKSKQIDLSVRSSLLSGGIIVAVAIIMLIINVIFGTAFFGLALNEKYSIYNMVLLPNCYLSALVYLLGLIAVLFGGYFYQKLLTKKDK